MKIVRENLNFERGRDPKAAMGLGSVNHIIEAWRGAEQVPGIMSLDLRTINNHLKLRVRYHDISSIRSFNEVKNIIYDHFGKEYFEDFKFLENYFWLTVKDKYEHLFQEAFRKMYGKGIVESLDFERGKDPKRTMRLGLPEFIAKGLRSLGKDPLVRQSIVIYKIVQSDRGQYSSFPDDAQFYFEIPAQEIPTKELMAEILDEHIGMEYFSDIWEDNQLWHIWRPMIKEEFGKTFVEADKLKDKTFESINFERTADPKEKMKIGRWQERKVKNELRKVYTFFNEPWLEKIINEYTDKILDSGIEIEEITPHVYEYTGGEKEGYKEILILIRGIDWEGNEYETTMKPAKQGKIGKPYEKNVGINVLFPVVDELEWQSTIRGKRR